MRILGLLGRTYCLHIANHPTTENIANGIRGKASLDATRPVVIAERSNEGPAEK
jgi:hypothetical protein